MYIRAMGYLSFSYLSKLWGTIYVDILENFHLK